jgi:hypothetical protein
MYVACSMENLSSNGIILLLTSGLSVFIVDLDGLEGDYSSYTLRELGIIIKL